MNNYPQFTGNKFRFLGTKTVYNQFGDKVEKGEFGLTRSYVIYLRKKEQEMTRRNLQRMYHKLQYQMETYGEVDNVDYEEFMYELKRSGLSINDITNDVAATS